MRLTERIPDRNVWLIYAAILFLGLAYGLALALVGIFLDGRGFTKSDIGNLAVWFALGVVAFSIPAGKLIARYSARTTVVLCLVGWGIAIALFPHMQTYRGIAIVRFFDGAASVGILVACETIVLSRAKRENKAFVTSLYSMAMSIGYVIGPFVGKAIVAFAPMTAAFAASGVIAAATAGMVALRLDRDVEEGHFPESFVSSTPSTLAAAARAVLSRIKTSCFATFAYGYFQAAVVLFLPIYLVHDKGIDPTSTILIPAFFAAGMLLFINPAGRLGDAWGHLPLMRLLALFGGTMVLGFVFVDRFAPMCGAVFVAGATLGSISPLSLALQGIVTKPHEYSKANALYNVFYAAGMLLGPAISSRIFDRFGGKAMLFHLAAVWAAFVVFSLAFRKDDPRVRKLLRAKRKSLAETV